jgi:molybdopterin converting factor small subunit
MKILAFAAARERIGFAELEIVANPAETPRAILQRIAPQLSLADLRAAVDYEYWDWDTPIGAASELAVIPPVSGG